MKLPQLKIGELIAKIPIIQGGMAIRVSTGLLAGAAAAVGAIGIIGASGMKFDELRNEIKKARSIAKGGIVGINIMFAAREFLGIVASAIKEKIDLIITGAGISRDIFKIGRESKTSIVPIVSSARLAKTFHNLGAAALVIEGKEAGGHLGTNRSVKEILPEIRKVTNLPLIAAGGIINGRDIVKMFFLGANGVQMATRFVLAEECNASQAFKEAYINAKEKGIVRISSPTGFPGQAIRTKFVEKIVAGDPPRPTYCDYCLKSCTYEYCIYEALMNALQGNIEEGVVFAGEKVTELKNKNVVPAAEIIKELIKEVEETNEEELAKEVEEEQKYFRSLPPQKDRSTRVIARGVRN